MDTLHPDTARTSVAPGVEPRWMLWTGRVLSAIPVLMMLMSGGMKLVRPPQVVELFVNKFGYNSGALGPIGVVELACVVLYLFPRTAVLGAILVTGYLGGAVATHARVADVFIGPLMLGIFAWAGLYLRDARIRALIPLRAA